MADGDLTFKPHVTQDFNESKDGPKVLSQESDLIQFRETSIIPANLTRDQAFSLMEKILTNMVGVGFVDKPPGRRNAYLDCVSWEKGCRFTMKSQHKGEGDHIESSCATFIRNVWWLMGAREEFIGSRLGFGTKKGIIRVLINHAQKYGAAFGPLGSGKFVLNKQTDPPTPPVDFKPKKGDVLYIFKSPSQHIFTVTDVIESSNKITLISIDGGQNDIEAGAGGKFHPQAIKKIQNGRSLTGKVEDGVFIPDTLIFKEDGPQRPIVTWIQFDKLFKSFKAPLTETVRKKAPIPSDSMVPKGTQGSDADSSSAEFDPEEEFSTRLAIHHPVEGALADKDVVVSIPDGTEEAGKTDENGIVRLSNLSSAIYRIRFEHKGEKIDQTVASQLDPIDTKEGVWQRLINLGYVKIDNPGSKPPEEGDDFTVAVMAFQLAYSLETDTGEVDEETRTALLKAHDEDDRTWKDRDWPEVEFDDDAIEDSKSEVT